jgi:hypothetical protein
MRSKCYANDALPLATGGIAGWQRQRRHQAAGASRTGAGRRRAGLRGLRSEEDQEIGAVKKAVKKVGTSRKRVERRLGR